MGTVDRVLVTGGAGFIGSHVADSLLAKGYSVCALDNLDKQVHSGSRRSEYLSQDVEFVEGDVRNRKVLSRALKNVDAVVHLAATVGVGQSMYEIEKYVSVNTYGTSLILDSIVNEHRNMKKIVVASSMAVYGEGSYRCENCGIVNPTLRNSIRSGKLEWDPRCPNCGRTLTSIATNEDKPPHPTSVYSQTKLQQEEMVLLIGRSYRIPSVALRFFNVYGPRQSLMNPYTGVAAIFLSRLLNGKSPYIFEDGLQTRDFVHVRDVANAVVLALESQKSDYLPVNIGSGEAVNIYQIAELLARLLNSKVKPLVSQRYRKGDIRHCYGDISRARTLLNYKPKMSIQEGFRELVTWAKEHRWQATDSFDKAFEELKQRNLA